MFILINGHFYYTFKKLQNFFPSLKKIIYLRKYIKYVKIKQNI